MAAAHWRGRRLRGRQQAKGWGITTFLFFLSLPQAAHIANEVSLIATAVFRNLEPGKVEPRLDFAALVEPKPCLRLVPGSIFLNTAVRRISGLDVVAHRGLVLDIPPVPVV
jgi:hypothetical protein